jgi:hypothetical protein
LGWRWDCCGNTVILQSSMCCQEFEVGRIGL